MMEKIGITGEDKIASLREEEAQLMSRVAELITNKEKTASQQLEHDRVQTRLAQVRQLITDHDLKKDAPAG